MSVSYIGCGCRYHVGDTKGERVCTCLVCGAAFASRIELTNHMKMHETNENDEKRTCPQCGSSFTSAEALALHITMHMGDTSLATDANLIATNFNLSFEDRTTANNLVQKQKNHICPHCSKAFSAKHGLHQHNKRNPEGTCALKSHVCPTCNKGFFQKNHLLLHQRQHMDLATRMKKNTTPNITEPLAVDSSVSPLENCAITFSDDSPNSLEVHSEGEVSSVDLSQSDMIFKEEIN